MKKLIAPVAAVIALFSMSSCHDDFEVSHERGYHVIRSYTHGDGLGNSQWLSPDSSCVDCQKAGYLGLKAHVTAMKAK